MINHPNRGRRKIAVSTSIHHNHERDYPLLMAGVREAFAASGGPLFLTDASGLFDAFLDALPSERQMHNCTACRRFVKEFGGLVRIADDGTTTPAMWGPCPDFYHLAIASVAKAVRRARVISPFLSNTPIWGTPRTGEWWHLSVDASAIATFHDRILTPKRAMAEKREDFKTVAAALADFTPEILAEALRVFEGGHVDRSEKFIAPVRWLLNLHTARSGVKGPARDNILWRAISTAPSGFCHPRASVVGSLLEDIAAGKPFDTVKRSFNEKVGGLIYQRPQTAPSAGNIAAAEKIVENLGIVKSLDRRFARLDDLETVWRPNTPAAPAATGGIFRHLMPKGGAAHDLTLPAVTMTWDKFSRTVLPAAEEVKLNAPPRGAFIALTAAVHADSPPILKWDRDDRRNPVAWYLYYGGSPAYRWGIKSGWCDVTTITMLPPMWGDNPLPFLGEGAVFILKGAVDRENSSLALFPEHLRAELHAVRATIEAHSRIGKLAGAAEASACGYALQKGGRGCYVRVLSAGKWNDYHIDRWD